MPANKSGWLARESRCELSTRSGLDNKGSLCCGPGFFFFSFFFLCHYLLSALQNQPKVLPRSQNLACPCPFQVPSCLAAVLQPSSGSAWDPAELYQLSSEALISPMELKIEIASPCISPLLCWGGCSSAPLCWSPGQAQLQVPWCSLGGVTGPPKFRVRVAQSGVVWRSWRALRLKTSESQCKRYWGVLIFVI